MRQWLLVDAKKKNNRDILGIVGLSAPEKDLD
jgi:hypothetical protein